MTQQVIPLNPFPSQTLSVNVGGQSVSLKIYQKSTGLFMDIIAASGALLPLGTLCLNGSRIIRDAYWGFVGDFAFIDTLGNDDPASSGLGSRWVLVYTNP